MRYFISGFPSGVALSPSVGADAASSTSGGCRTGAAGADHLADRIANLDEGVTMTTSAITVQARPVWLVSAGAGVVAAAATELYGLVARFAGIPMAAGSIGAATAEPVTVGMFAMGTLICTFWGTVLAVVFARYAADPARAYLRTTVVLTALSLVGPLAAGATAIPTRLMLALAHLIAAAIIIPVVTRRLSRAPGRRGRR
jgi:hypothetical protein